MGTIKERPRRDGTVAFLAEVVVKSEGKVIHREAMTHDDKRAAERWIEQTERAAKTPGGVASRKAASATLADTIDRYVRESRKAIGSTKAQVLNTIKNYPIADMKCSEITSEDIISFAQQIGAKVQPQTVANYLSHLGAIFTVAKPAWKIPLDRAEMDAAYVVCKRMGYVSKSKMRERRPTLEELNRILKHIEEKRLKRPSTSPLGDVILFALFSSRRQEEITRIRWEDFDREGKRILVRDLKHPGEKIGNDQWCDLPDEAVAVIERQPKGKPEIFPYNAVSISASFTRICQFLEIEDLHFHDLRHECISWLAEIGLSIPHIAAVSGHRSWQSLRRYSHVRSKQDKFDGWARRPKLEPKE